MHIYLLIQKIYFFFNHKRSRNQRLLSRRGGLSGSVRDDRWEINKDHYMVHNCELLL